MRIIAGEFRSRKLTPPRGDVTRPVTDRVKQSLFDILNPRIADANVYDCFAGTGSMGLECLSRGATFATFFESDGSAVTGLNANIQALGVKARSRVISVDLFKFIKAASTSSGQAPSTSSGQALSTNSGQAHSTSSGQAPSTSSGRAATFQKKADLIFLDPPYRFLTERKNDLCDLASRLASNHLSAGGIVIFRHEVNDALDLPELSRLEIRDYGQMRLEFLIAPDSPNRLAG